MTYSPHSAPIFHTHHPKKPLIPQHAPSPQTSHSHQKVHEENQMQSFASSYRIKHVLLILVLLSALFLFTLTLFPHHASSCIPNDTILPYKVKLVSFVVDFIFSLCGIAGVEDYTTLKTTSKFNRKLFESINPKISETWPSFSHHVRTRDVQLQHFVGNATLAKENFRLLSNGELDSTGLMVRVCEPATTNHDNQQEKLPLMIFFHGGGFVLQHVWDMEQTRVCSKFARHGPMIVIAVDYRLAPEHPYPANIRDMMYTVDWLVRERTHHLTTESYMKEHNQTNIGLSGTDNSTSSDFFLSEQPPYNSNPNTGMSHWAKAFLTGNLKKYHTRKRSAEQWRYLIPQNVDWNRIFFCGDSAGGQLAASASLYVKERYPSLLPYIKQQILIYPSFALVDTEAKRVLKSAPVLNEGVMMFFIHAYAGFNQSLIFDSIVRDPYVNPMLSQVGLKGMPPTFFVVAGEDPLQDDSKIYARHLQREDVPVRVLEYPGLNHGFFTMSLFSESELAMHQILDHMRRNQIL